MAHLRTATMFQGDKRDYNLHAMRISDTCALCGMQIIDDMIWWRCNDDWCTDLWLHRACANQLGEKLIADAAKGSE